VVTEESYQSIKHLIVQQQDIPEGFIYYPDEGDNAPEALLNEKGGNVYSSDFYDWMTADYVYMWYAIYVIFTAILYVVGMFGGWELLKLMAREFGW
jgi:hypothetical protein